MPVFRNHTVLNVARGVKAFFNFEVGVTRGEVPISGNGASASAPAGRPSGAKPILGREPDGEGVRPENLVWIFGTGRSGSTWLRSMMGEFERFHVWEEPMVGKLFGGFYDNAQKGQLGSANFIMSDRTREGWLRSVRGFTLDGARYAHPNLSTDDYLVVKEPNGTEGAPILMEALPESRMIFLVRDPRDVAASSLDAARKDSWLYQRKSHGGWKERAVADNRPDAFVKQRSKRYLLYISKAKEAYEVHRGPKVLVRYEELVEDTFSAMGRVCSELGLPVGESELSRAVKKHSWENIPEEEKGEGKFYRKGSPGSWREDLTKEQAEIVEETTGPLLREFYPG
jgi:hypothetical protein